MSVLKLKEQLSRNSQELNVLDIDHPTPSPEPPIRSPIRSPSAGLTRTRLRIDSETDTRTWSSPAFLKRNQLPYATYLNTQYDPFRDESIFEDGERRKKMKLGRKSYQWTFANTTPSPGKEDRLEVYESSRAYSLDVVEGADVGTLSTANLQSGLTERKWALINDIGHDENLPQHAEDEAMVDELAGEKIAEHDPKASFDVDANGHNSLIGDALPGVTTPKLPDRDTDGESSTRQGPDRLELRLEPSEVKIRDEYTSQFLAQDRQSTPTRRHSSIRQESPSDAIRNSPNRDPVDESPMTKNLDKKDFRSGSIDANFQNDVSSQIPAEDRRSTPAYKNSSIRQESHSSEATDNLSHRDPDIEPPMTESINAHVQNKDSSQFLANGRRSTPIPRDSSMGRDSSPIDATNRFRNREPTSESPNTKRLDREESPPESCEDNMQDENPSQVLDEDHQSSPIRKDSSVGWVSPNHARRKSPDRVPDDELSTAGGLNRQVLHPETSDSDVEDIESSQIVLIGRQSSSASKESSISQDSLSNWARDTLPEQIVDNDSLPGKGNDDQESHTGTGKDVLLPEDRYDSSAHRDSPLEDANLEKGQKFKLSRPSRQVSPSESTESPASIDSTSQDSVADSQASLGHDVFEDHSSSVKDAIDDDNEAFSTASPLHSPYADIEERSDDQSGTGNESEDEVVYLDFGIDTCENSPDSQTSSSSPEVYGSSNGTPEGVPDDTAGLGLDGLPISVIRSTVDHFSREPEDILEEPENSLAPIGTVADDIEKPKHEALVANEEANPDSQDDMNVDRISPNDEIAKAKKENERQEMRPMTLDEDGSNEIFRESGSFDIEDESPRHQNKECISADVSVTRSGEDDETEQIAALHKPTSNASPDENRDLEKDISTREDEFNISPDDNYSPAQQDNESQFVQTKPTLDIIDLESEEEDNIALTGPQVKEDPSQSLIDTGKVDDIISEDGHLAKQEYEWPRSEGHSEDHVGKLDAGQATHDAPTTGTTVEGSEDNVDSHIEEFSSRDTPSKDTSRYIKTSMDYEHDSGVQHQDPEASPQSSTSALEEALLGNTNFDPILRSQLFTPLSSQQRSLKSEQSIVSEKNQQLEHKLPTPRQTQNISAPPLPPITPEPLEKPSMVERIKAMKTASAKTALARKSMDNSKPASDLFMRKRPSQLTHVSDSEGERESRPSSEQVSIVGEEPPEINQSLEPSCPNILIDETPQTEKNISRLPPSKGLRTSFAYYPPLSTLHSHFGALTSVLTVLHSVDPIVQSRSGPRDFQRSLFLSDPSSMCYPPIIAQIFRPKELALPIVNPGDAILLRNFKVQSFEKRLGLLSTNSSAWAVFRRGVEVQIRGPPVEFGPEERGFIKGLWKWWESVGAVSVEKAIAEVPKKVATERALSAERECGEEDEVGHRSKSKTDLGKSNTSGGAKGKVLGRTRGQIESDMTPTPDSGRHQLRDGTSYPDSTPEKGKNSRSGAEVHELRDGTTYTDTDADSEADDENKFKGRVKTKSEASAAKGKVSGRTRSKIESDITPTPDSRQHQLRDGTSYPDSTPEKGKRSKFRAGIHELRDGTTYTDTDADADAGGENKVEGRLMTKSGPSAKPAPAAAEKGGRRVRQGTKKKKEEHKLRDGP